MESPRANEYEKSSVFEGVRISQTVGRATGALLRRIIARNGYSCLFVYLCLFTNPSVGCPASHAVTAPVRVHPTVPYRKDRLWYCMYESRPTFLVAGLAYPPLACCRPKGEALPATISQSLLFWGLVGTTAALETMGIARKAHFYFTSRGSHDNCC